MSQLVSALRRYAVPIALTTLAVTAAYAIGAIIVYLMAPSQRVTTQPFRLQFQGATLGEYPNGIKFSAAEVVSLPNLIEVYRANELGQYMSFDTFSRSVFVLESNPEYDRLAADYQARLADRALTPIDRDRLQREFETKRDSIAKNSYSINFLRTSGTRTVPETLVRKSITDVLKAWAERAVNEQRVTEYRLSLLTPQIVDETPLEQRNYIVGIQVLRSKLNRVLDNIRDLQKLPGSELIRSPKRLSLEEIRMRIDELKRFRLEPLVSILRGSGLIADPGSTIKFLEAQLAYDQRQLRGAEAEADQIRRAFAMYVMDERALSTESSSGSGRATTAAPPASSGRAPEEQARGTGEVVPQLSDSFLDRLVTLTNRSADVVYRQQMVTQLRAAATHVIPAQQAVDYDEEVLQQMKNGGGASARLDAPAAAAELTAIRKEARTLIVEVNEIYAILVRNMNPSTQLYTMTTPPSTHVEHSASLPRLALWGVVVMLITLALSAAVSLLHERFTTQEAEDRELAAGEAARP